MPPNPHTHPNSFPPSKMAKSMRSKWKKKMKAEKARAEAPKKAVRLEKLNEKLGLAAIHKLRNVPLQEPCKDFHFKPLDNMDASQRLVLPKFTTNVHKGLRGHEGNADGPAPSQHPQARMPRSPKAAPAKTRRDVDDDDDIFAPAGGAAPTDAKDVEAKYAAATKKMASDFVPAFEQVVGKRARNASKVKAEAAAAAATAADDAEDDDAVAVAAPRSVKLATAAEKKRTGSSKMPKAGGATKKSPAAKRK